MKKFLIPAAFAAMAFSCAPAHANGVQCPDGSWRDDAKWCPVAPQPQPQQPGAVGVGVGVGTGVGIGTGTGVGHGGAGGNGGNATGGTSFGGNQSQGQSAVYAIGGEEAAMRYLIRMDPAFRDGILSGPVQMPINRPTGRLVCPASHPVYVEGRGCKR